MLDEIETLSSFCPGDVEITEGWEYAKPDANKNIASAHNEYSTDVIRSVNPEPTKKYRDLDNIHPPGLKGYRLLKKITKCCLLSTFP